MKIKGSGGKEEKVRREGREERGASGSERRKLEHGSGEREEWRRQIKKSGEKIEKETPAKEAGRCALNGETKAAGTEKL